MVSLFFSKEGKRGTRSTLLHLAKSRFGPISPAEKTLFEATEKGERADCGGDSGERGVIRSDRLTWLCTDPVAAARVTYRGISIVGAEIEGEVDLEWAKVSFPLRTRQCVFTKAIILQNSHVVSLDLADTSIKDLRAESVIVERSVILSNGFKCEGSVNLARATIGGYLMCDGGKFLSADGLFALDANNANIQGDVFLSKGFRAERKVDLLGTSIGGNLVCGGGQFVSVGGKTALDAGFSKIQGNVSFHGDFQAEGGVDLDYATIDGELSCIGSQFFGGGEASGLSAYRAKIHGDAIFNKDFKAEGGLYLVRATIGGHLHCGQSHFVSKGKAAALDASDAEIHGDAFFGRDFKAEGGVNLVGAKIDGDLMCADSQFLGRDEALPPDASGADNQGFISSFAGFRAEGGLYLVRATIGGRLHCVQSHLVSKGKAPALDARDVEIHGDAFFGRDFKAEGGVNLVGAKIDGDLMCADSQFFGRGKERALDAGSANIQGNVVLFYGFRAEGGANLAAATIRGNLQCIGGHFLGRGESPALDASGAEIHGNATFAKGFKAEGEVSLAFASVLRSFRWVDVESPEKAILILKSAKVGTLFNPQNSWPGNGHLLLGDFVYDQIDDNSSPNADVQLRWLHRQPQKWFFSQPYEQLADVLRKRGLKEDARKVMIVKNKDYAAHLHWRLAWLWYGFFGKLIGYGYRPRRAFLISLLFIAFGCWLFNAGFNSKVITPPEERAFVGQTGGIRQLSKLHPRFDALAYSVETFVPFLKLGVSQYWMPNATCHGELRLCNLVIPITGRFLRYYLWLHITAGWVLSALWVGAITGFLKT